MKFSCLFFFSFFFLFMKVIFSFKKKNNKVLDNCWQVSYFAFAFVSLLFIYLYHAKGKGGQMYTSNFKEQWQKKNCRLLKKRSILIFISDTLCLIICFICCVQKSLVIYFPFNPLTSVRIHRHTELLKMKLLGLLSSWSKSYCC